MPLQTQMKRNGWLHMLFLKEERQEYSLFKIHDTTGVKDKTDPLFVTVNLNGKQVPWR